MSFQKIQRKDAKGAKERKETMNKIFANLSVFLYVFALSFFPL